MYSVLKFRYLIYIIFFFSFLGKGILLKAQAPWGNVYIFPYENRLRLNLEIGVNIHQTKALGFSHKKTFYLKDGGQANNGLGAEVFVQHRFRKNSLWAVGVLFGYQNLSFQNTVVYMDKFTPLQSTSSFRGNTLNANYLIPNIAFRGGVKWKFELSLGLGLGLINGGGEEEKIWLLEQNNMTYTIKQWQKKTSLTIGYRAGISLGYLFKKRFLIATQFGVLNLSGKSTAQMKESNHIWNIDLAQIEQTLNEGVYSVKQKINYKSYFFGLTLKYQIYKTLYPHTITKNGIIYH